MPFELVDDTLLPGTFPLDGCGDSSPVPQSPLLSVPLEYESQKFSPVALTSFLRGNLTFDHSFNFKDHKQHRDLYIAPYSCPEFQIYKPHNHWHLNWCLKINILNIELDISPIHTKPACSAPSHCTFQSRAWLFTQIIEPIP